MNSFPSPTQYQLERLGELPGYTLPDPDRETFWYFETVRDEGCEAGVEFSWVYTEHIPIEFKTKRVVGVSCKKFLHFREIDL